MEDCKKDTIRTLSITGALLLILSQVAVKPAGILLCICAGGLLIGLAVYLGHRTRQAERKRSVNLLKYRNPA